MLCIHYSNGRFGTAQIRGRVSARLYYCGTVSTANHLPCLCQAGPQRRLSRALLFLVQEIRNLWLNCSIDIPLQRLVMPSSLQSEILSIRVNTACSIQLHLHLIGSSRELGSTTIRELEFFGTLPVLYNSCILCYIRSDLHISTHPQLSSKSENALVSQDDAKVA